MQALRQLPNDFKARCHNRGSLEEQPILEGVQQLSQLKR